MLSLGTSQNISKAIPVTDWPSERQTENTSNVNILWVTDGQTRSSDGFDKFGNWQFDNIRITFRSHNVVTVVIK